MVSVILPASVEEPALIDTLAALIEGVAEGIVRDCVVVSAAPSQLIERCTDAAGCMMVTEPGPRDALVRRGAALVRSEWSLVITPGLVPSGDWLTEIADWIEARPTPQEAAFIPYHARRGLRASWQAMAINLTPRITGRPHALNGFLAATASLQQTPSPRLALTALDARMLDRRLVSEV